MREVQAADADIASLLAEVERGESLTIMQAGKAVARVVPVIEPDLQRHRDAVERLREWRRQQQPQHLSVEEILEMRDEGRR